jgi:hypothetical protein
MLVDDDVDSQLLFAKSITDLNCRLQVFNSGSANPIICIYCTSRFTKCPNGSKNKARGGKKMPEFNVF